MKKICNKCGLSKKLDNFYVDIRYRGGYTSECKSCHRIRDKNNYKKSAKKIIEKTTQYRKEHSEQHSGYVKKYQLTHLGKVKKYRKEHYGEVYNSPKGKLNKCMSSNIYISLLEGKSGRHWETLVNYTIDQLKQHLEKRFLPEMSWNNYNRHGWHIDHKIPISVFNFQKPEDIDFKRCWALSNLQPMWARDNIIKSDRLTKPFQPSLLM